MADEAQDTAAQDAAAVIVADRQWPITVTLRRPVQFGSELVASLEFRRGRMGDLKGMPLDSNVQIDQLLLLASRMCGKPLKVIEMLEDEDGAEVIELALGFFARSLGAGRKR